MQRFSAIFDRAIAKNQLIVDYSLSLWWQARTAFLGGASNEP
jgi:hypothetical protein